MYLANVFGKVLVLFWSKVFVLHKNTLRKTRLSVGSRPTVSTIGTPQNLVPTARTLDSLGLETLLRVGLASHLATGNRALGGGSPGVAVRGGGSGKGYRVNSALRG